MFELLNDGVYKVWSDLFICVHRLPFSGLVIAALEVLSTFKSSGKSMIILQFTRVIHMSACVTFIM